MNDPWINKVILNFFANRIDLFGEESTYQGFETNEPTKTSNQAPPDGFNSVILRGKVIYKDVKGNTRKSTSVAIKVMPDPRLTNVFLSFAFANEINFYIKIVPTFGTLNSSIYSCFPKFYHAEMMSNEMRTRSAIVFEDLIAKGYKQAAKKAFLDLPHLTVMMRKLGQFHAFSYKAKNTSPEWFVPMAKSFQETDFFLNGGKSMLEPMARRGADGLNLDPKQATCVEKFLGNVDKIYKRVLTGGTENAMSVITHGDYLRNNVMFRYTENNIPDDLLMFDLATRRYGSPVIDLANVLYINTDQATRDKHWDELIDEYYSELKGMFPENPVPSRNEILNEFVGKSFYAYLVAAYFLPRLIAVDNNIPYPDDIDPDIQTKFDQLKLDEIPTDMWIHLYLVIGQEQGTIALRNVLRDMIDRGFISEQFEFE